MNRFVALAVLVLLSSCADLKTNVSGSFACGAPQGTCAPTMSIDDGALAKIARDGNAEAPKSAASADPAPSRTPETHAYPARQAHIVFPGYTDAKGQRHDPVGVYVTLNDARFVDTGVSDGTPATRATVGFVPSKTNLLLAASAQSDGDDQPPVAPVAAGVRPALNAPTTSQTFPSSTVQN